MNEATQQFGKYRILGELGRGGFATVYRAVDTTLDREIALKILHPQLLADSTFVQRFRQEARTLAALHHPHIVTVYEVSEAEGRLYIATELAHGVSLARAIAERGRIPWEEALALLKTICAALDYAHSRGIVHRDLKPANILLDAERGPLLTDFGFARLMGESSVMLSMSGGVIGTPGYIAPEVWEENAAEAPADIYALGCIVYEMLTGDVLFKGQTPMQVMRAHDRGPAFPEAWPNGVQAGVEAALRKALAHDPAARYPNAMALWHALNDLEAAARAAREAAAQAAVAAQWRAEAEAALAAGEWSAARMAIGRWLAVAPDDPAAKAARAKLERLSVLPPPKPQTVSLTQATSDLLQKPVMGPSSVKDAPHKPAPTKRGGVWKLVLGLGGIAAVSLLVLSIAGSIRRGAAPSVAPRAAATQPPAAPSETDAAPAAPSETDAAPAATAAPVPVAGGTLRIAASSWPDTLDPQKSSFTNEIAVEILNYEGLTRYDKDLKTVPAAAEKWEYNEDATEIAFHLRDGLTYSDGSPLTAPDFVRAVYRTLDPHNPGDYQPLLNMIKGADAIINTTVPIDEAKLPDLNKALGVQAVDDKIIKFTFTKPTPYFHTLAAIWVMYPAKQELIDKGGETWYENPANQIGNGPFQITTIDKSNNLIEFKANENYWPGRPKLDGVQIKYIGDRAVALQAYKNGEIDIFAPAPNDVPMIKGDPVLSKEYKEYPGSCTLLVTFNLQRSPFDNKIVRAAFALAFDREGYINDALKGANIKTLTWIPPGYPGYDPDENRFDYDPDKAKGCWPRRASRTVRASPR